MHTKTTTADGVDVNYVNTNCQSWTGDPKPILKSLYNSNSNIEKIVSGEKGITVRESNHSHPYNTNAKVSEDDITFAKWLYKLFPNTKTSIFFRDQIVPFNKNTVYQGNSITPAELDEVVITPK